MHGLCALYSVFTAWNGGRFFMLITDVISEYIFDCEIRKFSLKTIRGYRNNLLYLEKYLKGYDITRIEEIKTIHLKSFFKHISDSGRKESYMNGLLKTFRAFFKYAVSEEYISVNPCLKVPWAKEAMPLITIDIPNKACQKIRSMI